VAAATDLTITGGTAGDIADGHHNNSSEKLPDEATLDPLSVSQHGSVTGGMDKFVRFEPSPSIEKLSLMRETSNPTAASRY
jgi:hypothetical protein